MKFLVLENKKVIWGVTTKCGSSYLRQLFLAYANSSELLQLQNIPDPHENLDNLSYDDYTIIGFVRNPYTRVVSAFLDKYGTRSGVGSDYRLPKFFRKSCPLRFTFKNLVQAISIYGINERYVDVHHFELQYSNILNKDIVFDKIDYNYLNATCGGNFDSSKINISYTRSTNYKNDYNKPAYLLSSAQLKLMSEKPPIASFYNADIIKKVRKIYAEDFEWLQTFGFNYLPPKVTRNIMLKYFYFYYVAYFLFTVCKKYARQLARKFYYLVKYKSIS